MYVLYFPAEYHTSAHALNHTDPEDNVIHSQPQSSCGLCSNDLRGYQYLMESTKCIHICGIITTH